MDEIKIQTIRMVKKDSKADFEYAIQKEVIFYQRIGLKVEILNPSYHSTEGCYTAMVIAGKKNEQT